MVKDLKREIENGAKDLVERIREYSRSQKDLWKQISIIAPEIKKKAGLVHRFDNEGHAFFVDAYDDGCLEIPWRVREVCIDLKTGELVSYDEKNKLARDKFVLELALSFDRYLNADCALAELNADSRRIDYLLQQDRIKWKIDYYGKLDETCFLGRF